MSLSSQFEPVQPVWRPTAQSQIDHYGVQLVPLAALLAERQYSDGAREEILAEAGEFGTLDHSIAARWLDPADVDLAVAMLCKGVNEQATRLIWRERNESRWDGPELS